MNLKLFEHIMYIKTVIIFYDPYILLYYIIYRLYISKIDEKSRKSLPKMPRMNPDMA